MKTKKKVKILTVKEHGKNHMVKSNLIGKLKKSKMPKTVIARALGYKSHNTIKYWFDLNKMPLHQCDAVKKLLKIGK